MKKKIEDEKTLRLKKIMKQRKTKNLLYEGIYTKFGRKIVD